MSPEEAKELHRVLKQHDLKHNSVHSVVSYDLVKERHEDYKEMQLGMKIAQAQKTFNER